MPRERGSKHPHVTPRQCHAGVGQSPRCLQCCLLPVKAAQPRGAAGGLPFARGSSSPPRSGQGSPWPHRYSSTCPRAQPAALSQGGTARAQAVAQHIYRSFLLFVVLASTCQHVCRQFAAGCFTEAPSARELGPHGHPLELAGEVGRGTDG